MAEERQVSLSHKVTADDVWAALAEIPDPEIPVISLVDLGVIKDVHVEDRRVRIEFTPTFMGCPALEPMKVAMERKVSELGAEPEVRVARSAARQGSLRRRRDRPASSTSSNSRPARSAAPTAARPTPVSRTSSARRRAARFATATPAASRSSSSRRSSSVFVALSS